MTHYVRSPLTTSSVKLLDDPESTQLSKPKDRFESSRTSGSRGLFHEAGLRGRRMQSHRSPGRIYTGATQALGCSTGQRRSSALENNPFRSSQDQPSAIAYPSYSGGACVLSLHKKNGVAFRRRRFMLFRQLNQRVTGSAVLR